MQEKLRKSLRALSILIFDWLRYELQVDSKRFLRIRNRMERIAPGPSNQGYVCLWPYTSRLSAVEEWRFLGRRLLKRLLRSHNFTGIAERHPVENPLVSIIIGHRGIERLPLLLATISSVASQKDIDLECIIVEQDVDSRIKEHIPGWVKYIHQNNPYANDSYNRSSAFNYGVRHAKGSILLLHDNDMLLPEMYCSDIKRLIHAGYEVVNPKRFVFYLSKEDTDSVLASFDNLRSCCPDYVVQNLEAGGSVAITKRAYMQIGGMDESFIGWGGEDNEFWSRCSQVKKWIWGYAPIIHLWHRSQPQKGEANNVNVAKAKTLLYEPVEERTRILKGINQHLYESSDS